MILGENFSLLARSEPRTKKNRQEGVLKADNSRKLAIRLAVASIILCPIVGWVQGPFPAGQGRDSVVIVCSQCHPLTRISDSALNAEQWELTLYDMIARGAPLHKKDLDNVRRYLIENFATDER